MSDVIRLLPEAVANQIAAGEVIQRPASVVKELVENSVDAGGSEICVLIKDAGKSSIQIIDNGCGMSDTDARMAFERHATSKIKDARDLFSIRSLGFRGEALASIAAIAEIKLKTKRHEDEIGNMLDVSASRIIGQEPVSCNSGSNFLIKNLFFNTPARRKFLKATNTEFRHILNEFQRIVLARPEIEFKLHHNEAEIYNLPQSNFRQRICNVFGRNINPFLVPVNADTSIVKISGFISKPDIAKRTAGDQFMFVNRRFIKHPMLHKAVMKAYEGLLPTDHLPAYFIYFEVDPETIDINIHPTKTEVKFEDDVAIFQILQAAVKESLGKFNVVPSIDFDSEAGIEIPYLGKDTEVRMPEININPHFNPFDTDSSVSSYRPKLQNDNDRDDNLRNWDRLYSGFQGSTDESYPQDITPKQTSFDIKHNDNVPVNIIQLKNKYILTPVKSGLMVIDQKRAHERILFEQYMEKLHEHRGISQRSLFPQVIQMGQDNYIHLQGLDDELHSLGFEIEFHDNYELKVLGTPSDMVSLDLKLLLEEIVAAVFEEEQDFNQDKKEKIACKMAQASAIPYGKPLSPEELKSMVDKLFASSLPNYSPTGKNVISIINIEELEKNF
ncbi:MAG TPA: DNA mismatch repair endonuclease MutL [Bacteroidales bacterium]|nr:DNA mismatch repair endonuclease MutL [Bacteroidales bacterium]